MLKNNNRDIVNKISSRTLEKNKTRNIFVILAIVLTTFMFTTVFGIGFSFAKNLNKMMLRQQGTKSTIFLNQPDNDQMQKIEKMEYLDAMGVKIQTGKAYVPGKETGILLDWYDKTEFNENLTPAISDIKGKYPAEADEIMLSKSALDVLGINNPEKDMEIKLKQDGKDLSFRLSGWYTDYGYTSGGFQAFISNDYVNGLGLDIENNGILCMSAKHGKQSELLESLEKVPLNKGQEIQGEFDIQQENNDTVIVTAACLLVMGLIIATSGYLLIYNVMYISVTKDIRFYGMLKTIGTSPSQIKKIVKRQALVLSVIGIPAGIILGGLMSFAAMPYALKMLAQDSAMPTDISFNPLIYAGTIIFAVITILVSCRKPAKLAGKVSPVEALKYNGSNSVKYKAKKGTDGGKIYKMAYRNVFREKKRAVLVFASLFMGTMAFLSVDTFIGSLKLDNYVDFYLPDDYSIYTDNTEGKDTSGEVERLAAQIKSIDGIKNMHVNRSAETVYEFDRELAKPFIENWTSDKKEQEELYEYYENAESDEEKYSSPVVAVSKEMMELYNQKARQKIDIDKFEKGEVCLLGFVKTNKQSDALLGKKVTIKDIESGKKKTFEIGACPTREDDNGINVGYYWMQAAAPDILLVSDTALSQFCNNPSVDNIIVNCQPEAESFVTQKIKEYTKTNSAVLETQIKSEISAEFKSSMSAMNIIGGGISAVLILIGVINFINVMLTGVYTRKGELSILESVGMTKKQVKKMLVYEGMYYAMVTVILVLTLGNAIVYKVADFTQEMADYAVFHYPVALIFIIAAVIICICMIVPAVVYQMFSKESITERLRKAL